MAELGRLFVGTALPDEIRLALATDLQGMRIPGKPVPPGNWHLTLVFLGDTDEVRYERLLAELDQTVDTGPFGVTLAGLGAFPNSRRATVLWVGVGRGGEELTGLAAVVGEAAAAVGFEVGERPYRPHLTISRIRPDADVRALIEHPLGPYRFDVDELVVFRSHLGGSTARYEVMERLPLR